MKIRLYLYIWHSPIQNLQKEISHSSRRKDLGPQRKTQVDLASYRGRINFFFPESSQKHEQLFLGLRSLFLWC